jgi:hypothetical protein
MKRQPSDPFGGMGHFVPKVPRKTVAAPKARKPQRVIARADLLKMAEEIRRSAEAALARIHVTDVELARQDFEWIRRQADDLLKAG